MFQLKVPNCNYYLNYLADNHHNSNNLVTVYFHRFLSYRILKTCPQSNVHVDFFGFSDKIAFINQEIRKIWSRSIAEF